MPLPPVDPAHVRRAAEYAADAIRLLRHEGLTGKEIAAGFALAIQRLPIQAWADANPGRALAMREGLRFVADVVKAVRDGTPPKVVER